MPCVIPDHFLPMSLSCLCKLSDIIIFIVITIIVITNMVVLSTKQTRGCPQQFITSCSVNLSLDPVLYTILPTANTIVSSLSPQSAYIPTSEMNERIQILLHQGEMNGHTKMVDNTKEEKLGWERALHIYTPIFFRIV